jgi:hypothetical protein
MIVSADDIVPLFTAFLAHCNSSQPFQFFPKSKIVANIGGCLAELQQTVEKDDETPESDAENSRNGTSRVIAKAGEDNSKTSDEVQASSEDEASDQDGYGGGDKTDSEDGSVSKNKSSSKDESISKGKSIGKDETISKDENGSKDESIGKDQRGNRPATAASPCKKKGKPRSTTTIQSAPVANSLLFPRRQSGRNKAQVEFGIKLLAGGQQSPKG